MTHKEHQLALNKMWKNRKKGKIPLKFLSAEEKMKKFLDTIGDRYSSKVKSEALTKKWKREIK